VHDALADPVDVERHEARMCNISQLNGLDMMVIADAHHDYRAPGFVQHHLLPDGILIDVKSVHPRGELPGSIGYWSL